MAGDDASRYRDIRKRAMKYWHDGKSVVISDKNDEQDTYDFDDLMISSRFVLILAGDDVWSFRFNEAVCSGGVPVLVTNLWIPPFENIVPFETYGVLVRESSLDNATSASSVLQRLRT